MGRYAELHCRTAFSFLEGVSSAEELLARAKELELHGLAVTDVNGLHGIVEAREALLQLFGLSKGEEGKAPVKLLYGSELRFEGDRAVALVRDRQGYAQLSSLITEGRLAAEKGGFELGRKALLDREAGLVLLAGGPGSEPFRLVCAGEGRRAELRLAELKEAFGDRLHLELTRQLAPGDLERSLAMAELGRRLRIPVVATNDVRFHERARKPLQDIARCIAGGFTLEQGGRRLLPNAEAHLKGPEAMARLFEDLPEAVERTVWLADQISFRLSEVRYRYPAPALPPGEDADSHLARLARAGLAARLGPGEATQLEERLQKELSLVEELEYAGYFLTMHEIVNVCRERGILCQGRGSAANSLICFGLGITSVRPDTIDMLFERFISKERNEPPDIDLDIEHERREEVIQYVYRRFGREHAAMVSEVIRYRARSAIREVGKALSLSDEQLGRLATLLSHGDAPSQEMLEAAGLDGGSQAVRLLMGAARAMEGLPRHLSIHVGGFVLSEEPLRHTVPIENGRMEDRTVIQWDKNHVDAMGMFKLDLLGLGMLTVLSKAFALVKAHHGVALGLETTPPEDAATYAMLRKGDSVGVFQVESRAQMNMLPRLRPESFYDLVIQVAIVRPGPIQGQMVHPYLRRRRKEEPVEYPHPKLEAILGRTYGVPLFQEQVMRLAEAVGGYTAGEADQLRRDMARWGNGGRLERHRRRLLEGMRRNGLSDDFAQRVIQQIEGFGSYGFPESHAAAFAHLAYVSAYVKCHYPAAFGAALINSQPMGFYSPAVIVNDLKRHGVEVLPVDVQRSAWDCTLEAGSVRLGLRMVHSLGEAVGRRLVWGREKEGAFSSVEELAARADVPSVALASLAAAGALKGVHPGHRRQALWRAMAVGKPLGPLLRAAPVGEPEPALTPPSTVEELSFDARYAGAFAGRHPMELVRRELSRGGVLSARELLSARNRQWVTVAGLVITRQRPGNGKIIYVTLEDETGHVDVAVREEVYDRNRVVIRLSGALKIRGRVMTDGAARNVAGLHFEALDLRASVPSHDFH